MKGDKVVAFAVTDPVGWSLKAELLIKNKASASTTNSAKLIMLNQSAFL